MAAPIVMPKLGLTMTEGLLASWRVAPGDEVRSGDVLFVVETEKIATEIEAQADGRIETLEVAEGDTAPVGATVATWVAGAATQANELRETRLIEDPAASALPLVGRAEPSEAKDRGGGRSGGTSTFEAGGAPPTPSRRAKPGPQGGGERAGVARLVATPLARRMARERGVDLAEVEGSGPRGRIKAADVGRSSFPAGHESDSLGRRLSLPEGEGRAEAKRRAGVGHGAYGESTALGPPPSGLTGLPPPPAEEKSRRPATSIEAVVARRMALAKQTIPHFYVHAEADVTRLGELRAELNGGPAAAANPAAPKITLTHAVVAALARALAGAPEMNVLWDNGEIVAPGTVEIGVAVDTPRGLLVPVLRDAARLTLDGVAAALHDLVARARGGRLTAADLEGGTVSVSNVGMFGASALVPIIDPGQSAILGVAAAKPVFRPDAAGRPVLRHELGLVLSCDHRVIDGARAARFLDAVRRELEHPARLMRAPA